MKIGFVSLGCSKNLVDTEMMIGMFKENKDTIVNNPNEAEVIVINTCGFIESAKEEAINTILEMAEYKKKKCKFLIVTGCLVQRYKEELIKAIPEVDLFISIDEYPKMWEEIEKTIRKEEEKNHFELNYQTREISTGETTAYLKIAEGCSNRCTYCAIPYIRGPFISRPKEEILEEARNLAQRGFKEIIVIAQDTTKYGIDLYGKPKLAELLQDLANIKEFKWIRFLYSYPETITEELIKVVKENSNICKYFDIPIQHISDRVLKRMNRKSNGESIKNIIKKIREEIPEVIIRTTLIVGFPGETKDEFKELYEFVKQTEFDRLGAFSYSKEEGTPAARLTDQIHPMTKKSRYHKIMSLQKEIDQKVQEKYIGKSYEVLIDGKTFDGKYYIGRTYMQMLEIDGIVYVKNTKECHTGDFIQVEIVDAKEYDLIAEIK